MAETGTTVRFTNKDVLPEELARFEGLSFDDNNRLVGLDEEGQTTQIRNLGHALMEFAISAGAAEEVTSPELTPEIQDYIDKVINEKTAGLQNELKALRDRNTELEQEIARLRGNEVGVGGFKIGDKVGLLINDTDDEAEYEKGYEVVGFAEQDDRQKIVIKDTETEEEQNVEAEQLSSEDELDTEDDHDIEESKFLKGDQVGLRRADGKYITGFEVEEIEPVDEKGVRKVKIKDQKGNINPYNETLLKKRDEITAEEVASAEVAPQSFERNSYRRFTGAFGDFLVGRQVALHNGAYNLMDRRGRKVIVEEVDESVAQEYVRSNERVGAIAAGALAVGAIVGIVLYEFFEDKVFGHSHVRTIRQTVTIPGAGGSSHVNAANGSISLGGGIPAHGPHGAEHIDFFNSAAGHRRTGAILPHGLKLGQDSFGHDIIMNSSSKPIVSADKLPNGIMQSNGALTKEAVAQLRKLNFNVGYIPARNVTGGNNLYMSVVS